MSTSSSTGNAPPLLVPVEGVLLQTDLLAEALARLARLRPARLWAAPVVALRGGRAAVLEQAARVVGMRDLGVVLCQPVAEYLEEAMRQGRDVIFLAPEMESARQILDERFPGCQILTPAEGFPVGGDALAAALAKRFGADGYDFIGGPEATHAALADARLARVAVRGDRPAHLKGARKHAADLQIIATLQGTTWRDWVMELRLHQWAKNFLIVVPFLAGHHYAGVYQIAGLVAAFLAMGLCASATYIWNDILDIEFDRLHATKRRRLLASGRTSLGRAFGASVFLLVLGLLGGFLLNPGFGGILVFYILLTFTYSVFLKRLALVDLFTLTSLYLTRIVAGVLVGETMLSFWLFAFSFLFFLSLAAAKRLIEIRRHAPAAGGMLRGRGYTSGDAVLLTSLGVASGIASALMLALYSESAHVRSLYAEPNWLWGACVLCLFWISRVWLLTERGELDDDPVVFAMTDKVTLVIAALGGVVFYLANPL